MIVHENEWYWFAGLYEGEGSVSKPPASEPRRFRLSIEMTDLDVLQRAGRMLGHNYINCRKHN
ncbi:MAG: LAGLIDADG family homing endonuclease, partial [Anaerolineae bacterium]|nr:LAGLIDADG family homing endonuclease [Anaerolineae bacterium]